MIFFMIAFNYEFVVDMKIVYGVMLTFSGQQITSNSIFNFSQELIQDTLE